MQSSHERKALRRISGKYPEAAILGSVDGSRTLTNRVARTFLSGSQVVSDTTIKDDLLPLKHVRLAQLRDAGLNCAPWRVWLRGELREDELCEFFQTYGRVSLRNFIQEREGDPSPRLPVAYEQSRWDAVRAFAREHNRTYHTMVHQTLPLAESLWAGNAIALGEDEYLMIFFEGSGTPRDTDVKTSEELHVFRRRFGEYPPGLPDPLKDIPNKVRGFMNERRPMAFEFSVYPGPVGLRGERVVFWEWRGGAKHDLLQKAVVRLLESAGEYEFICKIAPGA